MKYLNVKTYQKSIQSFYYRYKNSNGFSVKVEGFRSERVMFDHIKNHLADPLKGYTIRIYKQYD